MSAAVFFRRAARTVRDLRESYLFDRGVGEGLDENAIHDTESEQLYLLALVHLEAAERYLKLAAIKVPS